MRTGKELLEWLDTAIGGHEEHIATLRRIKNIAGTYLDLRQYVDRWGRIYYCTPAVNNEVTDCEVRHNCSCCPDSPIEVLPFIEHDGVRLYAYPIPFVVGEESYTGEIPYSKWREQMRMAGIAEAIIEKVQDFFDKNVTELKEDESPGDNTGY